MTTPPDAIYGLRAVERMTGISADTIRAWQERYAVVRPVTGPGGEQLYSRDDIERLRRFDPAGAAAAATPEVTPAPAPAGGRTRLLIMLAERDPYAAELTEYFLRTEGYGVDTVFDPEEALTRSDTTGPDLAIVDLLIDGGAGFALARQLRELDRCPVIVISALDPGDHPDLEHVDAFLRKPLSPLTLVSTVRDLLGTSALVDRSTP